MRIAILGGPGSGKEIQAKWLAERSRVPCISVGGLLRKAAAGEAAPAPPAAATAPVGGGSPADGKVMALLEQRLRARDSKRGFVIDGFPRNIPQAQALDTLLGMLGRALQISVRLKVDDRTLVKRITGQLPCSWCGAFHDRLPAPPKTAGQCQVCGAKLADGGGHNAKTAAGQIEAYHRESDPLVAYYKAQHKLRTVPADGSVDEVKQKICDIVDLEIHPLEMTNLEPAAETSDEQAGTIIVGGQINRIDPTSDILASRQPRAEAAGNAAAPQRKTGAAAAQKNAAGPKAPAQTPATPAVAPETAEKSADTGETIKKPAAENPPPKPAAGQEAAVKKDTAENAAENIAEKDHSPNGKKDAASGHG